MSPDFIKSTLTLLHKAERHASHSEQHDALKNSRVVLHFILGRGESAAFAEFLASFDTASSLPPVLSFTTQEEAEAWLQAHPAPPHGAVIGVENTRYNVAYSRELGHRRLLRLPSEEEWEQMEAGEEEEAGEEPSPPSASHGTRFNLFDLFNRTCVHLYEIEQRMSSPEELAAVRTAKIAFHFVMHVGEYHGFEEYLESIHSARTSLPLRSFANREEADTWLETQPEPPPPAVVALGGDLYSVGYNRRSELRLLLRIPTPQELDAGAPLLSR